MSVLASFLSQFITDQLTTAFVYNSISALRHIPAADFSPIHHLLVLTEGETELDSDKEIPDIFSKVGR